MVIPDHVKVGAMDYDVKIISDIIDTSGCEGRICPRPGIIEIKYVDNEEYINQVFIHELVHALHLHMGLDVESKIALDERYIDGFAQALYMLIEDNPGIFEDSLLPDD